MLHVVPAVLYVGAIFVVGTLPVGPKLPLDFSAQDKLGHLLAFLIMQLVLLRCLRFLSPAGGWLRQALVAALMASALGGLLELWQSRLPTRSAEWLDLCADALGALAGVLIARMIHGQSRATTAAKGTKS
jgi:VanZ family protein